MPTIIITGDNGRQRLLAGADAVADAVKITLGPKGRNAILGKKYGSPVVTNDGVTIAREIDLSDSFEKMGAELIKQAASKTNDAAGDGTTTACVLAQAIIREGLRNVTAGANPMELKRGIEKAVNIVVEELEKMAVVIDTTEQITSVATISAQDPEIGKLIAEAMDVVGKDGVISVEEGRTIGLEKEVVEGMQFDSGFVSPYMISNPEKMEAVHEDALILITDKKIAANSDILALRPLLETLGQQGRKQLVIIAEGMDGEALTTFVYNRLQGVFNVLGVKAPGFGDKRKEMLQDIAILTGGTLITHEIGLTFDKVQLEHLGRAEKVIANKDKTIIVGGKGNKKAIEQRVEEIRAEIERSDSEYDKEKLAERLAKLAGGVAVVRVGAATEVELKDKKLRIEDALNSTRAAVQEGIVAGGGSALLCARKGLEKAISKATFGDEKVGMEIVLRSLSYPARQIAINAGQDDGAIIASIPDKPNYGYNAATGVVEDLVKAGVIDPKKVTRSALQNAASVAAMFLTTETMVAEALQKDKCCGGSCQSGNGGAGMDF